MKLSLPPVSAFIDAVRGLLPVGADERAMGWLLVTGAAGEAALTGETTWSRQIALASFAAALGGSLINILLALRHGARALDVLLAGLVSLFAGVVLAPALVQPLEAWLPGLASAGQVPVAGCVALFGTHYIRRLLHHLNAGPGDSEW